MGCSANYGAGLKKHARFLGLHRAYIPKIEII